MGRSLCCVVLVGALCSACGPLGDQGADGDSRDGPAPAPSNNLPFEGYDPIAAGHVQLTLGSESLLLGEQVSLGLDNQCRGDLGNYGDCGGPRVFTVTGITFSGAGMFEQRAPRPLPPFGMPIPGAQGAPIAQLIAIGEGEVTITAAVEYVDRANHKHTFELSKTARVVRPPTTLQITCDALAPDAQHPEVMMTAGAPIKAVLTFIEPDDAWPLMGLDIRPYLVPAAEVSLLQFATRSAPVVKGPHQVVSTLDTSMWPAERLLVLGGPDAEDRRTVAQVSAEEITSFQMIGPNEAHTFIAQPFHHDTPVCHNLEGDTRLTLSTAPGSTCGAISRLGFVRRGGSDPCIVHLSYDNGRIKQTFDLP